MCYYIREEQVKENAMDPQKLIDLLTGHKVYIQTHNFPDPDAIASAFGLQVFLKEHGIEAEICYDGKIERLSTRKMFDVFGIAVKNSEEISAMKEDDYIVCVDSQKYNTNLTDFIGDEVACIDHHPTFIQCEYHYKDVRIVGACASLIAEYFFVTKTPMDSNLAAALSYGIKMDTADFIRGTTDLDIDMFSYVYHLADKMKISEMYSNVMELDDLKAFAAAIESIKVYDNIGFARIPFDCPDGLIAIISDFILSLGAIEVSIVYSLREDGIKFSVRSEIPQSIDAGVLTRKALSGIGSGGGHKEMAGGFVNPEYKDTLEAHEIEKRFLETVESIK